MQADGQKYLFIVMRYLWVIIITSIVAGGFAYMFRLSQPETYSAEVNLYAGNTINSVDPELFEIEAGELLARAYSQFVLFPSVVMPVIEEFELDVLYEEFIKDVDTQVVAETPVLKIFFSHEDQELVADIANALANSLIENNPASLSEEQITALFEEIDNVEAQMAEIQETQGDDDDNEDSDALEAVEAINSRYNALLAQLETVTSSVADMQAADLLQSNKIQLIEPAITPSEPTGIKPIIIGIAGGVVGAILATSVILFFAFIDSKLRNEVDVQYMLSLPLLGQLKRRKVDLDFSKSPSQGASAYSTIDEEFRTIFASIMFSLEGREDHKIYLISSAKEQEGRTHVASNLAIVAAQAGSNVLLVDASFRAPKLHDIFGVKNSQGLLHLLTLLKNDNKLREHGDDNALQDAVQKHISKTSIDNLHIITSGVEQAPVSSNSIGFENLKSIMDVVKEQSDYDIVIIDSSPVTIADAYIVAAKTDADVLLVIESGRTSRKSAQQMKQQFERVGSKISGVILNKT